MEINEKEFAVIREISNNHLPDQRTIAVRSGISLGLANLIIKKLIKKGYVKAKQLNQKKIQYLLTPKGFTEKARKSYNFTVQTITMLRSIREAIKELIQEKSKEGAKEFVICGNGELSDIAEMALITLKVEYSRKNNADDGSLLEYLTDNGTNNSIDLITYISQKSIDISPVPSPEQTQTQL